MTKTAIAHEARAIQTCVGIGFAIALLAGLLVWGV